MSLDRRAGHWVTGRPGALLQALRSTSRREPAPRAFVLYVAALTALAAAALTVLPWMRSWDVDAPVLFVALAGFVLAGELLPIPVPRRRGMARVTISAAFAFAILLRFGPGPAAFVYVGSSVVADLAGRVAPLKNAAFATYAEEHDGYSIDRLALAAQLRRGIERGELVVHYQPKVPLGGGPTLALEALGASKTENVKQVLAKLGCDYAQGFHLGRPVVAEECTRYLGSPELGTTLIALAS